MKLTQGGNHAFVTGAASGIGASVVETLLIAGWNVIGFDRDWSEGDQEAEKAIRFEGDVCDLESIEESLAALDGRGLDLVVHCAGVGGPRGAIDRLSTVDVQRTIDVNVMGTCLVARAVLPALRRARGVFVAIASAMGIRPVVNAAIYAASKAAVVSLCKSLALEEGARGVRAFAVCPGPTDTPFYRGAGSPPLDDKYPYKHLGRPDEVARSILWLATEATGYTGSPFIYDSGRVM